MKLHTKLILALLACLSSVVILAQVFQFLQISGQIEKLSESNLRLLTEREENFSKNLYRSVANSVADSLNRGEMDKFNMMLKRTSEVEGLEEFSLFDTSNTVTYSSESSFLNRKLGNSIEERINDGEGMIFEMDNKSIEIYHPQPVVQNCIRCHTDWSLKAPHGGILYFRFSAEALTEAKEQAAVALDSLNQTYITDSVLSVIAVIVVLVITIFLLLRKMVAKPLDTIGNAFGIVAEGDLTVQTVIASKDEIGVLSQNFNSFINSLHQMMQKISEQVDTLKDSSSSLTNLSGEMSSGTEEMAEKSYSVAESADNMSNQMSVVADSMMEANNNINMVAAATEEMTSTIDEIAENSERARQISEGAVSDTHNATEKMRTLGDSAQNIGKVTETISEISDQTNLLALNATIEAARAGEAGKGFAVVAQEIKDLARQTSVATTEIGGRIDEIQSTTSGAIEEIEHISRVIEDVNGIITTIATAVEEQSVATREIASNISQASHGIDQVNENVRLSSEGAAGITEDIKEVDLTSSSIAKSSSTVKGNAYELALLAEILQALIAQFKLR